MLSFRSVYIIIRPRGSRDLYALDCEMHKYARGRSPLERLYLTLRVAGYKGIEPFEGDRGCIESFASYLRDVEGLLKGGLESASELKISPIRVMISHILSPTKAIFRSVEEGVRGYVATNIELSLAREMFELVRCVGENSCERADLGYLTLGIDPGDKKLYLVSEGRGRIRLTSYEKIIDLDRLVERLRQDHFFI
ncbi:MAG TPA: hypothetical protein VNL13_01525 [Sulfolobales archaeon]|nr:hypothetical protein [Sulfolobales archaeon]